MEDEVLEEVIEALDELSENPDYTEQLTEIITHLDTVNENLIAIHTMNEQIYTSIMLVLAVIIVYDVGKFFSDLFTINS